MVDSDRIPEEGTTPDQEGVKVEERGNQQIPSLGFDRNEKEIPPQTPTKNPKGVLENFSKNYNSTS